MCFSLLFATGCTIERGARKEDFLKEDLYRMRTTIDRYSQDKHRAPQHLSDLVSEGYLQAIPKDPCTNSTTTWVEVMEDPAQAIDRRHPGLVDVRSSSHLVSSDGTRCDKL